MDDRRFRLGEIVLYPTGGDACTATVVGYESVDQPHYTGWHYCIWLPRSDDRDYERIWVRESELERLTVSGGNEVDTAGQR